MSVEIKHLTTWKTKEQRIITVNLKNISRMKNEGNLTDVNENYNIYVI
jgi:hypothetical protein